MWQAEQKLKNFIADFAGKLSQFLETEEIMSSKCISWKSAARKSHRVISSVKSGMIENDENKNKTTLPY